MYSGLEFNDIDKLQVFLLEKLFNEGEFINTRGLNTLEICNVNVCLVYPRNRDTFNPERKWKLPLAIGEFAWHVSGSNSVDFIAYYARQWKDFSSDGKVISQSCYGHKIFNSDESSESQWKRIVKLLKQDRYSRRAVLDLYNSNNGLDYFAKDIACVCTVQFLVRKNKLDSIVTMRSNDVIWGLPYDIYLFTMLQELLALELGIELGCYYHNVGSMHIYERHFDMGKRMIQSPSFELSRPELMENTGDLESFLNYEVLIRTADVSLSKLEQLEISVYWKKLLMVLWRHKFDKEMALKKTS